MSKDLSWSHLVHIVVMLVAWVLLTPFGIAAAALRSRFEVLREGEPQLWFRIHKRTQYGTVGLTLVGAALGIYAKSIYGLHFQTPHSTAAC